MRHVAPRIVNAVSCATDINHESHSAWQAQYLVILECHFSSQAQYLVKSGEIWVDSRIVKCCNFQYKMRCRGGKSKLCERTDHGRIMLESVAHCK